MDISGDSVESAQSNKKTKKNWKRKGSEWEILGSLEKGIEYNIKPKKHEGYLSKRRKWPLKGWHKRYFSLYGGILTYGKTASDIARGRTHGRIDVGQAVVSAKYDLFRIDINDEECIHHLKVDNMENFAYWLEQLKQHRLYQQNLLNSASSALSTPLSPSIGEYDYHHLSPPRNNSLSRGLRPPGSAPNATSGNGSGNSPVGTIMTEFDNLDDRVTAQLLNVQQHAVALSLLAQRFEDEASVPGSNKKKLFGLRKKKSGPGSHSASSSSGCGMSGSVTTSSASKQSSPGSASVHVDAFEDSLASSGASSNTLVHMSSLSSSNPSLSSNTLSRPNSLTTGSMSSSSTTSTTTADTLKPPPQTLGSSSRSLHDSLINPTLKDELIAFASDFQNDISNLMRVFSVERDKLKSAIDMSQTPISINGNNANTAALVSSLRSSLNQAIQQNTMLKSRLQKIHMDSEISELPSINSEGNNTLPRNITLGGMNHSLSYSSSCVSEFFDAREYNSENEPSEYSSDEDSLGSADESTTTSDEEEGGTSGNKIRIYPDEISKSTSRLHLPGVSEATSETNLTGRRQKLPTPKSDTEGLNLWNLLCKNIGKDLSKISMPVTLNEPLSALQRLCEELEYSDLLDKAASASTPLERMIWVSAFAVSSYGSSNARAGHKPFNPLLGETYECVREDRGFKYLAEQVSHHPPISACHATSKHWIWHQDLRVKTKFWGKSMEFQPEGNITLELKLKDDRSEHYTWNKITTCIHNLFGSERWVDLYGVCVISCPDTELESKIDFIKASYWSNKKHEVLGNILDTSTGCVVQTLFGKWSEALYCGKAPSAKCIWRPGALPEDHTLYYGFSRFAMELNELLESEKSLLPHTDTRFRPDQRQLEMGNISEAETLKLKLELSQRERRNEMEKEGRVHIPTWFGRKGDGEYEKWIFNEEYWHMRQTQNFDKMEFDRLW
ncbi:oxysterol-binding protein-related protein 3 [Lepeophtheirus salmonis]|uniref:Oxysterol-binding protein n=1 Tax=Lepeophtheirus salmonis TaxID=72036 RepID=A0A0K2TK62_LEPSM|nr:oxysterol-binding protein-related protein 3-like [Lepeophtheirus salmonis]